MSCLAAAVPSRMRAGMSQGQTRGPSTLPPSLADIDALAQAAIERLPDEFP